jgi:hypothetical protein
MTTPVTPNCPMYAPQNCKFYLSEKMCGIVRKDKTCKKVKGKQPLSEIEKKKRKRNYYEVEESHIGFTCGKGHCP